MADVVCLGILVADIVARPVDTYPQRGELILCDSMSTSIGGCAANTGIGLQKLGVSTAVIGKVGRDSFGDFVRQTLTDYQLDTSGVALSDAVSTSSTMVIISSDAERSFIHYIGANADFTADDINWDLIKDAKLLHVAGHFIMPAFDGNPCAQVLKRAQQLGIKTSLDTAWDASGKWMETLRPTLPHLDYFVPSFSEAQKCVDPKFTSPREVAKVFADSGVGTIALKMGERGSYIWGKDGEEIQMPPYRVKAVDANGAGDAFAAGFLAGVMHGFDLETTAKLANATGACVVTKPGAVAGFRSLDETMDFIKQQEKGNKK